MSSRALPRESNVKVDAVSGSSSLTDISSFASAWGSTCTAYFVPLGIVFTAHIAYRVPSLTIQGQYQTTLSKATPIKSSMIFEVHIVAPLSVFAGRIVSTSVNNGTDMVVTKSGTFFCGSFWVEVVSAKINFNQIRIPMAGVASLSTVRFTAARKDLPSCSIPTLFLAKCLRMWVAGTISILPRSSATISSKRSQYFFSMQPSNPPDASLRCRLP